MKYKGIIFDLDGVLCQTDEYHYARIRKNVRAPNQKLNDLV